jgi:hypothetical protein
MPSVSLQLPESLHRGIQELATKDGYSMTQFLITAAAEKLSAIATEDYLSQRAKRADLAAFDQILAQVPATKPDDGDELR